MCLLPIVLTNKGLCCWAQQPQQQPPKTTGTTEAVEEKVPVEDQGEVSRKPALVTIIHQSAKVFKLEYFFSMRYSLRV